MKLIIPLALFIVAGFLLVSGCADQTKNGTTNATTPTVSVLVTSTPDTGSTVTVPTTTPPPSTLKGSLKVSVSGILYPENMEVVLDNETVGTVNSTKPLYLMVSEGDHRVMVCRNSVCKQENFTIGFGKYVTVDFSEQLQKDLKFSNPTAQIQKFYKNGNILSVNVEFYNPSTKDLMMSATVSCRYSYIDDRTLLKKDDISLGMIRQNVNAGKRVSEWLNLYLASGNFLSYESPVLEELQVL